MLHFKLPVSKFLSTLEYTETPMHSLARWILCCLVLCVVVGNSHFSNAHAAQWIDAQKYDGVAYFLFADNPRIERYDMEAEVWLEPLLLQDVPKAFCLSRFGAYVSYGRRVVFVDNATGVEDFVNNTPTEVTQMLLYESLLIEYYYFDYAINIVAININGKYIKSTYTKRQERLVGWAIDKVTRSLICCSEYGYLRQLDISGSDFELEEGQLRYGAGSQSKVTAFPGLGRVTVSSGNVYDSVLLSEAISFQNPYIAIDFYGDLPLVLRQTGVVQLYSRSLALAGEVEVEQGTASLFVHSEEVVLFRYVEEGLSINVEVISLELLNLEDAGREFDPNVTGFVPDKIYVGGDNILYMLSKKYLSIFRWSLDEHKYLKGILLNQAPLSMLVCEDKGTIYLSYPQQELTKIDLVSDSFTEILWMSTGSRYTEMLKIGDFMLLSEPRGYENHCNLFGHDGLVYNSVLIHEKDGYYYDDALSRIYCRTYGSFVFWFDVDAAGNSSSISLKDLGYDFKLPLRVSDNGSLLVTGDGLLYWTYNFMNAGYLSNDIIEAIWRNNKLYTLADETGSIVVQQWTSGNFDIIIQARLPQVPVAMLEIPEGFLLVGMRGGILEFTVLNEGLQIVYASWISRPTGIYPLLLSPDEP